MKTLYLHIGTAKTATSSIQKYCQINRSVLVEHNYCYPVVPLSYPGVDRRRNAHFLLHTFNPGNWTEDDEKEYNERMDFGLNIVHEKFKEVDNVILSDESLWTATQYTKINPIEVAKKDGEKNGYIVKVIVYLRRQDDYLTSRWNQFVKYEGKSQEFDSHIKWIMNNNKLIVEYDKTLDAISDLIGKENVIVRRFVPSTWVNNSIYEDFADAIGFEDVAALKLPEKDMNPGLKGNTVEIKRIINTIPSIPHKEKVSLGKIAGEISSDLEDADMYGMFSVQETEDFLANFKEGNDYVAKEYLGIEPPLFTEEIKDLPKWQPNNKYMTEDVLKFFKAVAENNEETISYTDELMVQYFSTLITDLSKENERLTTSNTNLRNDVNELRNNVNGLRKNITDLQGNITKLNDANKKLNAKADKLNSELKTLRTDFNSFRYKIKHPFRTLWRRIFKKGAK